MKIWLATAKVAEIEALSWAPLEGIITNPSVLLAAGADWRATIRSLGAQAATPNLRTKQVHIQAVAGSRDGILDQMSEFRELLDPKELICKVPFGAGGLGAAGELVRAGAAVNVTAVCTLSQAQLALEAGTHFLSIYVARLNDHGGDGEAGYRLVQEIRELMERRSFHAEVIAASVRNPDQYEEVIRRGAHGVAAPPTLLEEILRHTLTESSLDAFEVEWARWADP